MPRKCAKRLTPSQGFPGRPQGYAPTMLCCLFYSIFVYSRGVPLRSPCHIVTDTGHFSFHDLDTFLQGVPIFEDFDSEKDRKSLEVYVARFQTEKGIHLPRHRFVVVAVKP